MDSKPLSNLQHQALILMQALLGVISENFRMVWVSMEDGIVKVHIVLEEEVEDDFEEIEDLKSEFEALQISHIDYEFETLVSDKALYWPNRSTSIVVYRRRE